MSGIARFVVQVRRTLDNPAAATLTVSRPGQDAPLVPPRRLVRLTVAHDVFPAPEAPAADPRDRHDPAALASDPAALRLRYRRVMERVATDDERLGFAAWLFHTLIGRDAWAAMDLAAAGAPRCIALDFEPTDWAMQRLPWEMMGFDGAYLATRQPLVALYRQVSYRPVPPGPAAAGLPGPADRVLFVTGVPADDAALRPAAELFALVQQLEAQGRAPAQAPLLNAALDELQAAVRLLRPGVVHLATHGGFTGAGGYIELRETSGNGRRRVTPRQLADALCQADGRFPIIVLSACDTAIAAAPPAAAGPAAEAGTPPFAAELVAAGAPMVVAMSGRVADRACRLFARAFYAALLTGGDPIRAVALGRQAGLRDGPPTADWAMPTIFTRAGLAEALTSVVDLGAGRARKALISRIGITDMPKALCGRLPVLGEFEALLSDGLPRVMALVVTRAAPEASVLRDNDPVRPRFGRSRMLREFARQALRRGHLALLLTPGGREPATIEGFCSLLARTIVEAYHNLGLRPPPDLAFCQLRLLHGRPVGTPLPAELPAGVRTALQFGFGQSWDMFSPDVVAATLRHDLEQLTAAYAGLQGDDAPAAPRCVLLVDDVERLGADAIATLRDMIDPAGLRGAGAPIPVVLAVDPTLPSRLPEHATAVEALRPLIEAAHRVQRAALAEFGMGERPAAYAVWLMHYEGGFVVQSRATGPDEVHDILEAVFEGVPSRLGEAYLRSGDRGSQILKTLLGRFISCDKLIPANDDLAMSSILDGAGQ